MQPSRSEIGTLSVKVKIKAEWQVLFVFSETHQYNKWHIWSNKRIDYKNIFLYANEKSTKNNFWRLVVKPLSHLKPHGWTSTCHATYKQMQQIIQCWVDCEGEMSSHTKFFVCTEHITKMRKCVQSFSSGVGNLRPAWTFDIGPNRKFRYASQNTKSRRSEAPW